jgi:hypothetical protein
VTTGLIFTVVLLVTAVVAIGATVAAVMEMFSSPWEPRR